MQASRRGLPVVKTGDHCRNPATSDYPHSRSLFRPADFPVASVHFPVRGTRAHPTDDTLAADFRGFSPWYDRIARKIPGLSLFFSLVAEYPAV